MSDYYSIDWDGLRSLPPADRFGQVRSTQQQVRAALTGEAHRAAAQVLQQERDQHEPGALTRAAKRLGISHQALNKLLKGET